MIRARRPSSDATRPGCPVEAGGDPPLDDRHPRLDFYIIREPRRVANNRPHRDVFLVRQLNPLDYYGRGLGDARR